MALVKHQLYFGNFYFYENYIIAEVAEGVFFDWKKALIVIDLAEAFYGKMAMPHYISHRIHKYHVNPADWLNFFQMGHTLSSYILVHKHRSSIFNLKFEKMFYRGKVLQFYNLFEAVNWVKSLDKKLENA